MTERWRCGQSCGMIGRCACEAGRRGGGGVAQRAKCILEGAASFGCQWQDYHSLVSGCKAGRPASSLQVTEGCNLKMLTCNRPERLVEVADTCCCHRRLPRLQGQAAVADGGRPGGAAGEVAHTGHAVMPAVVAECHHVPQLGQWCHHRHPPSLAPC